jgi:hypothetical protein
MRPAATPERGAPSRIDRREPWGHDRAVATHSLAPLLLAQALVERGLLDQISAGLSSAKYQLELYAGQGNTIYVVIAVVVILVLTRVKRNR